MKTVSIAAILALGAGAALAQDDCIENAVGQRVCGVDADAVRARIRAEQRLQTPGLDMPAGGSAKTASRNASVSVPAPPQATGATPISESGEEIAGPVYVSQAQPARPAAPPKASGSVYNSYGRSIFLRGGYFFADRGPGSFDAPSIATGYRADLTKGRAATLALEGELLFLRDREESTILGVPLTATLWGLAGLASLRAEYTLSDIVTPFASVGVGPAYFRAKLSDGVTTISDGDVTFAYSGRAGVEFNISNQFSLETAYRYLGTSQSGTPGFHSAELGLNYSF